MFRNYKVLFLCLVASMGIAVQAMPKQAGQPIKRKNQVEGYKRLGFSIALIRALDKKQEQRVMRQNPRHAGYIARESREKDAFLADLVNGQMKKLEAKKALKEQCRQDMLAQFRRS